MKRVGAPNKLTVFFDETCQFCVRVAEVLEMEEYYSPVVFLPMWESSEKSEYRKIAPYVAGGRFVAMDEDSNIYLDTNARLMVLYMAKRYRGLSYTLSTAGMRGVVELFFEGISKHRKVVSRVVWGENGKRGESQNSTCNSENCKL